MLFWQPVVEYQQIAAVIDSRTRMHGDYALAGRIAFTSVVRTHDGKSRTTLAGIGRSIGERFGRKIPCQHHEIVSFTRAIYAERTVTAMHEQVLQLHGTTLRNAPRNQCIVQIATIGHEIRFHEDLPYYRVDKRRMDAVSAKITRPRQSVGQFSDAVKTAFDTASVYFHFFNMPAKCPVEKAICKLYPPVLASTSSTSPAKYRPLTFNDSMVPGLTSSQCTPPAVTTAYSKGA